MSKRITIIHATGKYNLDVEDEDWTKVYSGLQECIKGEKNCVGITDSEGQTTLYPSDFLRNSVIKIKSHDNEALIVPEM